MILPPFDAARAKIDNSRDHIAKLEGLFAAYRSDAPMAKRVELITGTPQKVLSWIPSKPLPVKIPLVLGDAIHNLRAALDLMAGDVVRLSGENGDKVHFPFASKEADYDDQIKKKGFHKARQDAIDLLKSFKPYRGGNEALRALHDLDLTDKHKLLIATAQGAHIPYAKVGPATFIDFTIGAGGRAFAVGMSHDVVVTGDVLPVLAFDRGKPLEGQEVIPSLHSLADLTLSIVEAFARLFGK